MNIIEVCNSVGLSRTKLVMGAFNNTIWWLWENNIHYQVMIERMTFKTKSLWVLDWLYGVTIKRCIAVDNKPWNANEI